MRYKLPLVTLLFYTFFGFSQVQGVGINKDNPQQALHLGSQTGTIRVDGLNSTNNTYNGGGVDQTYPVYVDHNGDLTLKVSAFQNSDGADAYTTAALNGTVEITAAQSPNDGYETVEITSYTFTVGRITILEMKYSLSIEVFRNNTLTLVKDQHARNITNFFTIDTPTASLTETTRRYAPSSKCYMNFNNPTVHPSGALNPNAGAPNASPGYIYNSGTSYIVLTPGTHTLRFYGTVSSGITNQPTFVRFAGGPDSIFLRLY
ncbi:MAG: hypothetical protein ACK4M1_01780 [Flavobacterium sp.]